MASFTQQTDMGVRLFMFMLAGTCVSFSGTAADSPESVVRKLYRQVVTRRPLGIPKGADRTAISPFLSKRLLRRLDTAQACENDYLHRQAEGDVIQKPAYGWLETGLFSGANEKAIPAEALVERAEKQKDGSFLVFVRLTFKESFETYGRPPNPADQFSWRIAAVVVLQDGHPVVDDVLFFKDDWTQVDSRLEDYFSACDGPRWVGRS